MLQDFWGVSDHFTTLRSKGLKKKHVLRNEKEKLPAKKTYSKSKQCDSKDKRPLFFYVTDFEHVFVGWLISFIFSFLIIDHKHKCKLKLLTLK